MQNTYQETHRLASKTFAKLHKWHIANTRSRDLGSAQSQPLAMQSQSSLNCEDEDGDFADHLTELQEAIRKQSGNFLLQQGLQEDEDAIQSDLLAVNGIKQMEAEARKQMKEHQEEWRKQLPDLRWNTLEGHGDSTSC